MTFSRGTLVCVHRMPQQQDASVLVKHYAKMCKSLCMNWLLLSWLRRDDVELPCGVQIYTRCISSVWDEKGGILFLFPVAVTARGFSVSTLWNMQSFKYYWFSVVFLPHAFLCLFVWLLLAFSSSLYYTFPSLSTVFHLIFFFPIIFAKNWQTTFPWQQELVCLAEDSLTFLFMKMGDRRGSSSSPLPNELCE